MQNYKKGVFQFEKLKENMDHMQTDIYKRATGTDNAVCHMFDHCLELTIGMLKYATHTTQNPSRISKQALDITITFSDITISVENKHSCYTVR
jgi:hypothetical protein